MRNPGLEEAQAGIKIAGRNIKNLRYADDTTLMAGSKEKLKNFLMKVKEKSEVGKKCRSWHLVPSWQIDRETVRDFIFLGSKINADGGCRNEIKRGLLLGRKGYDQPRQHIKKQRHYFANNGPSGQSCSFSSSYVWVWEWNHKEGWALKNWCFWTVVWERTLESPLDCEEIKLVHAKGNQSWIFIRRTDAKAETPILWLPDVKNWLIRKDPDAGKDWGQEEKGMTEDEMVGWYQWLNGHEFEQALRDGDGQGSLACCSPWSRKESDMTERLNWLTAWGLSALTAGARFQSLVGELRFHKLHGAAKSKYVDRNEINTKSH